ncbi:MAG TPA: glycosyltransferase [Gemmatimonadaceae bacterium]|jgi:glycosyltransferase involved in cell wall biosynthesis|nr:glycosyltransferase [Gemmatimonadaceae bacterium]
MAWTESLSIMHVVAPGPVGGLESVVRALATGHHEAGHRVGVTAILDGPAPRTGEHEFLDALSASGIETFVASIPERGYGRERAFVAESCVRFRPDVAHTHGHRPDIVDGPAARQRGIPTVSTIHGFTHAGWRKPLYEYLQFRALRRADAVVAVSRPLVRVLREGGVSPERTHLIPNAYLPPAGAPPLARVAARAALGLAPDAFVAGWVGRLSREKGADVFVDALAVLGDPLVEATVIGTGREHDALVARARARGLDRRLRWAGHVPAAHRVVAAFDVLVLSSRSEGTPIVLFEAMAAGVPIVASAVGGVPDVVTPADALLVPPASPDALAAAIATVRRDPTGAAARADAARARLATSFSPTPWLEAYAALYAALAGRRSATTAHQS